METNGRKFTSKSLIKGGSVARCQDYVLEGFHYSPLSQSGSFTWNCWWHLIKVRSGWRHSGFVELNRRIWFCGWAQMLSFWNRAGEDYCLFCWSIASAWPRCSRLWWSTLDSPCSPSFSSKSNENQIQTAVLVSSFCDVINIEIWSSGMNRFVVSSEI